MIYKDAYMDSLLNKTIGETIKKYRYQKGMSLKDLSNKLGNKVSRQTISTYETGRSKIRISMFVDICKALDIDPSETLEEISMRYFRNAKL